MNQLAARVIKLSYDVFLGRNRFLFQEMLANLAEDRTRFAKTFRQYLCIRILRRRGPQARLVRSVEDRESNTDMDRWLDEVRENVIAKGEERLYQTFLDAGEVADELVKFRIGEETTENGKNSSSPVKKTKEKTSPSEFQTAILRRKVAVDQTEFAQLSAKRIIKLHLKGSPSLPETLGHVITALQATSVPAERSSSRARHARRPCQERQNDERYANHLFLRDFYSMCEPYADFLEGNSLSKECNVVFGHVKQSPQFYLT